MSLEGLEASLGSKFPDEYPLGGSKNFLESSDGFGLEDFG